MAQGREQRRLERIAHGMNRKARSVGAQGTIVAADLARIEMDHGTCRYCRIGLPVGSGSFDHVISFHEGGSNRYHNIARCCFGCQRSKFTKSESEHAEYRELVKICPVDGKEFRPRHGDWRKGLGKYCSRSCSAKARWGRADARTKTASGATNS